MKFSLLFLLSCLFLSGCAYSQKKQFDKVQVGMEKNDVLELMDSPQRTQRWHGMDRWTYIFYENDQRQEKEVHFSDGKANYVGEVFQPKVSASEQDQMNENSNQEVEALVQARKNDSANFYQNYESQVQGTDGIRYVPQFEPVQ